MISQLLSQSAWSSKDARYEYRRRVACPLASKRLARTIAVGYPKAWLKSKNPFSEAVRRERERAGVSMVGQKPQFTVGTRFKLSKLGEARNPRLKSIKGTIVGGSQYRSSLRVVLDGRKTPLSLHRDYIEPIFDENGDHRPDER